MHSPRAEDCIGRDEFINELVATAEAQRSVLLFGGRQSGKTSILLRTKWLLSERISSNRGGIPMRVLVPIYMDLMRLPHDAGPGDVYSRMLTGAKEASRELLKIGRFDWLSIPLFRRRAISFDELIQGIEKIIRRAAHVGVRFIFLFDESRRVLGERFPRGFQDNLFAFLYSAELRVCQSVSIVFAGAQELAKFADDDTSPIGTRAARRYVSNLDPYSIGILARTVLQEYANETIEVVRDDVFRSTGGHAGLARGLIERLRGASSPEEVGKNLLQARAEMLTTQEPLFRVWDDAFSKEASAIKDELGAKRRLLIEKLPSFLASRELNNFHAMRSIEELLYTGVALRESNELIACNVLYWLHEDSHRKGIDWNDSASSVWPKLEETERALREVIVQQYKREWNDKAFEVMRTILGEDNWSKINSNYESSLGRYPLSETQRRVEIVDAMYMGQFRALIVSNKSWHLFKPVFKEKVTVENMFSAIVPVRNDQAHFNAVPEKELLRCFIACDDLAVLIKRVGRHA